MSPPPRLTHDVVVIGAGAAGLMAAASAGQRGRRVVVLDHNDQPGRKILISGGGRCNFTNRRVAASNYLSANPHFATSALKRFGPESFLELVRRHKIAFHERDHGQLFCDDSARQIVDLLLSECGQGGVEIALDCKIGQVLGDGPYRVETSRGIFTAPALIIATGGLSLPKIGATGFALSFARRHGLAVTDTAPALVPLSLVEPGLSELSGIAVPAEVSCGKTRFTEAVLFTHRGLSGPAILQISSYWTPGQAISINLLPGIPAADWLAERKAERPKAQAETVVAERLPARLARVLTDKAGATGKPMGQLPKAEATRLAGLLNNWSLVPSGTEGYRVAEATLGGIDVNQISSKTMEVKGRPGLYVIGEAMDVTGWLGGYNFQWAWSSGWAAGQSV